ncbi:MAG: FIG00557681: hypothetical protein, partial [uncultured Acetobacteraceae bacterium]
DTGRADGRMVGAATAARSRRLAPDGARTPARRRVGARLQPGGELDAAPARKGRPRAQPGRPRRGRCRASGLGSARLDRGPGRPAGAAAGGRPPRPGLRRALAEPARHRRPVRDHNLPARAAALPRPGLAFDAGAGGRAERHAADLRGGGARESLSGRDVRRGGVESARAQGAVHRDRAGAGPGPGPARQPDADADAVRLRARALGRGPPRQPRAVALRRAFRGRAGARGPRPGAAHRHGRGAGGGGRGAGRRSRAGGRV